MRQTALVFTTDLTFLKMLLLVVLLAMSLPTMAFANALLIEDVLPWEFNSNTETLNSIGMPVTKISSSQLSTTNLSDFNYVVYASDQYQSYYDNIAANFYRINDYVQNGGVLIAHSAIWGWSSASSDWDPSYFLPGGVNKVKEISNSVNISDPLHPVISGPYGTLSEAEFQAWNYTTHGYFTDLVAGTEIVMDINDINKPIYIEYGWGNGLVRASMMTVEWGNNDPYFTRHIFRQNEFYANSIPEPATLILFGSGLFGFILRRKRA